MTVCIAAVCESAQKIVIAADRMLTYPPPTSLEFETEEDKIEGLAPSCVALASGSTPFITEIIKNTHKTLGGNLSPEFDQLLDSVKDEYIATRTKRIDETIIHASLGTDYKTFLNKGGVLPQYLQTQPQIYQQLFMVSQQFNLNTELIVAGIDNSGAHIAVVTHPGTLLSLDKLGYGAIGSGGIHAIIYLSLNGQTSRKPLYDTLYNVYAAKKIAEASPGVGEVTDIAIVEVGRVFRCGQPILNELRRLFNRSSRKPLRNFAALGRTYDEQHAAA